MLIDITLITDKNYLTFNNRLVYKFGAPSWNIGFFEDPKMQANNNIDLNGRGNHQGHES